MEIRRRYGRRFRRFLAHTALTIGFFAAASSSPVLADGDQARLAGTPVVPIVATPAYVLARLAETNRSLDAYQARVDLEFKLHSFPFIREHLDGVASFKRPNRYEVVFRRVPSYAKGFGHLSADLADPASWEHRFRVTLVGVREVSGHRDLVLRLVQRVRGQIDHQDVAVNPNLWEIDAMEYYYYNGGTIAMQQHYEMVGGFRLMTAQDAQIQIPYVKAIAHADYTDYHTNVALDQAAKARNDER